MSNERLLKKYQRCLKKLETLNSQRFTKSTRILGLVTTLLVMSWVLYYFRTIDLNPITILGYIVLFLILLLLDTLLADFIYEMSKAFFDLESRLRHQKQVYEQIIAKRVEPDNFYYEFMAAYPVVEDKGKYFREENGNLFFLVATQDGPQKVVELQKDVKVKLAEENDPVEYRYYAKKIESGIFKDIWIGELKELHVPKETHQIGFVSGKTRNSVLQVNEMVSSYERVDGERGQENG